MEIEKIEVKRKLYKKYGIKDSLNNYKEIMNITEIFQ